MLTLSVWFYFTIIGLDNKPYKIYDTDRQHCNAIRATFPTNSGAACKIEKMP